MKTQHLDLRRQDASNSRLAVIKLDGKLILETVSNFLQTMRPERSAELVLDMSSLEFLDSAGIGALVQLFVHRRGQGQRFALAALTQQAKAVMEVAGLLKLLPAYASVADAIQAQS